MNHLAAYLKKDGWIWAALIFCVVLCMMLGIKSESTSTEESRISRVLSAIDGAGMVEVAVHYEESIPCSAVIVAQGANDIAVQLRLVSAVTTLLGIDQDCVAIYQREGQR